MEEKLNDQMLIRRGKLEKIAALGFEPYGGKYECRTGYAFWRFGGILL